MSLSALTSKRVRISFRDTGRGLSGDQLAQLFEPFNRLGQESGAEQGTGIGLVVSKRLVELMGGAIGVESTVGVGSVFWVEVKTRICNMLEVRLLYRKLEEHQRVLDYGVVATEIRRLLPQLPRPA